MQLIDRLVFISVFLSKTVMQTVVIADIF